MKKLTVLFALCALFTVAANAQEFKKFKVGLGGGYAIPGGSGAKGGVLFYFEPAYRVTDQIQIGLRGEFAAMARGFSEDYGSTDLKVSTSGSWTLNGQYYFNNNSFRPFVGAGFGLYSVKAAEIEAGDETFAVGSDESKFGFYPRLGFDAGHFTMTIDYNLVGKSSSEFQVPNFETEEMETIKIESKNSYLGIRLGVTIGGGRK